MKWMSIFHSLVIPFLGGFALTLAKLIADQKLLSFDESNDIALDMVLLGVGALGAFYIKGGTVEATIDAGVGDAFLAAVLLYLRFHRKRLTVVAGGNPPAVSALSGTVQLILGVFAILWTLIAF
jgi:hypothetical protein